MVSFLLVFWSIFCTHSSTPIVKLLFFYFLLLPLLGVHKCFPPYSGLTPLDVFSLVVTRSRSTPIQNKIKVTAVLERINFIEDLKQTIQAFNIYKGMPKRPVIDLREYQRQRPSLDWTLEVFVLQRKITVKSIIFVNVRPCRLTVVYRRFGGMYGLHIQGHKVRSRKQYSS
jgi:hypothetical protein